MSRSLGIALAVMLCSALSFTAHAKQLRFAVGFPTGAFPDAARVYAEAVKKYTDESLSVRVYELSLLSLSEMSSGIGHGMTDIGVVLAAYFPAEYPHINMASEVSMLLALQENSKGKEGLAYAGAMSEFVFLNCPECNDEFTRQMQVFTGGLSSSPYMLLCNKPVTTRADLQGARIRTAGAAWARWSSHFGASPISMSGNEVFEALHQRVVDCAAISAPELSGLNLMDAVSHITTNAPGGVFAAAGGANINQSVWQKMTEDQRKGMLRAGSVMTAETSYNYEMYGLRDLETAKKRGVKMHTADLSLIEASREFIKSDVSQIAATYSKQHGVKRADELVATINKLVDKWTSLVADVDSSEALADLYWQEVFSKVDVQKHGMK